MSNKLLADLVLCLHFAFVLFVLFGGLIVLFKKKAAWFHIPGVIWSSVINLAGGICPLTPIENRFRSLAGQEGYEGGFIEHYIGNLVYPGGMTRDLELTAGMSVVVWNLIVYAFVMYRARHRPAA